MDVLLSHGYFLQHDPAERRIMKPYPPLGILYLSAYLKTVEIPVEVFDSTFETIERFEETIRNRRPTIVGLYSNLMTKRTVVGLIDICRRNGSRVVVGGPDVPEYAEEYLTCGAEVAVIGEGELTMADLVPAMLEGRPLEAAAGIVYKQDDGTVRRTPPREQIANLDLLPFPDRHAIDLPRYLSTWKVHHGMSSASLICARGCPYSCAWCSRSVYGESHRRRSVGNVVAEIESIVADYSPDMLWFADDVFTMNHKWIHAFADEMKRRGIRIPFECITRADRLNADMIGTMAELGAKKVWFGSESGSQRILDAMDRGVTVGEIRIATRLAREAGIETGLFVMLGYPGETMDDIEQTVEHLKLTGADHFLTTVAYPIKGTPFYASVRERLIGPGAWSDGSDRNLRFTGRYPDRFYWFANRYVVNAVRAHRNGSAGAIPSFDAVASYVKAAVSRVGMELTKGAS